MTATTSASRATKVTPFPVAPLSDVLGGEIVNVNLRELIRTITPQALWEALAEYGVLAFRDQRLTAGEFVEISRFLGELEFHVLDQYRMQDHPEVYLISNIVENGKPLGNPKEGFGWHTDLSYMKEPTAYTLLYGVEVPAEGADTLYCNTRMALAKLPTDLRTRIEHLEGLHSYVYMRIGNAAYRANNEVQTGLREDQVARVPDVTHPVVRTHPIDGRRSLYLGGDCLAGFVGIEPEEATQLASTLFQFALRPEFRYAYKWQKNDVVIWDNRFTMHTATEYDRGRYRRLIWRTSVRGEIPA
jgi:alpha-ketoglutarate-dependent taurine dioxygenase